jgi:lysophospholipase L1-like esterase
MISWLIVAIISTFLWGGLVFHTSLGDDLILDRYTKSYGLLLLVATVGWVSLNIWAFRRRQVVGGILAFIGITLLLVIVILPPAYIYLHQMYLDQHIFASIKPEAHAFFQIEMAPPLPELIPDTFRILALGGSTTYGSKLERNEAYPAVLESLLRERHPDRRIQVFNAGVPWHTTMHSLLRYVSRFSDWKPHVVIVMHAFNDIFQTSEGKLSSSSYRTDYGHFFGALGSRVNPKDQFSDSVSSAFMKNWLARTLYSDFRDAPEEKQHTKVDLTRSLPTFRRNLQQMIRRVTQDGARIVLATQPYIYHDDMTAEERNSLFYAYYYRDYAIVPTMAEQTAGMNAFNTTVRKLAIHPDIMLVDLEHSLPKSSEWMYDDVHYTVSGAARVARILLDQLPWVELLSETADTIDVF